MPTILLVDDDPASRSLAADELASIEDIELLHAQDGISALEILSKHTPHLVVTDLLMPNMGGLELITKVQEQFPQMPIILMTAYGNEAIAVEALKAGAASYVSKQTLRTKLVHTVQQVLEVADAQRQRQRLLGQLVHQEMHFELENDPDLVAPLVALLLHEREDLTPAFRNDMQVGVALQEALHNALYHGNLEMNSELRESSLADFFALAQKRRKDAAFSNRRIHVTMRQTPQHCEFIIRDDGAGFDVSSVPDPTLPENMQRVCGRGMLLMHAFMDEVRYNDRGNEVTMIKRIADADME